MKVIMVSDFYHPIIGGIEHHVRRLSQQLKDRGHEVVVVTTSTPHEGYAFVDDIVVLRLKHMLSNFEQIFSDKIYKYVPPCPDLLMLRSLRRIVKKFRPDVIHGHGWIIFTIAKLKEEFTKLPIVATLHDYGFICARRTLYNQLCRENFHARSTATICPRMHRVKTPSMYHCLRCSRNSYGNVKAFAVVSALRISRHLLHHLDSMIAVSSYVSKIAKNAGYNNVKVIPNFVDPMKLRSLAEDNIIDDGDSDLVFVGSMNPIKGLDILLSSYEDLCKKETSVKLKLILKTEGYIRARAGKKRNIKIFNNLVHEHVLSHIAKSSIVVIPSLSPEAMSSVALEAMSLSKPIVASKIGGNVDIIEDKKTGLLVRPDDRKDLAKSIQYLLENPMLAKKMGINGFERVKKMFSAERVVPRIEALYEEVSV
jgi:glycosyltransferase involved in cell wall biosynthesis